jgi:DNA-binding CsgD family transcriptional regulator
MEEFAKIGGSPLDLLTPRERECLRLVDQHLSSKEIARRLGISKHTVDTHLDKARQRLGVDTRYDAARLVAAHDRAIPDASGGDTIGIVEPPPFRPDFIRREGTDDRAETNTETVDRAIGSAHGRSGSAVPAGGEIVQPEKCGSGKFGADLHLGSAGVAAFGLGGDLHTEGAGENPGFGHAQTSPLQTLRAGASRSALPRFGADGRNVPSEPGPAASGGGRNDLSLLLRLGYILAIVIGSALGFGAVLAGLHALKDLV